MSFGDKYLDEAFDNWVTRTPEEAGYFEEICEECEEPIDEYECVTNE